MNDQNVFVLSIHPDPEQPLGLDLKDLLQALKPRLPRWTWCVRRLDWLGEQKLNEAVDAADPYGVWLSSQELLPYAQKVYQTIEGEFLAFPREIDRGQITDENLSLLHFPTSPMELAIVAVDGCFFDVYVKDADDLQLLKSFPDVREEDPARYFPQPTMQKAK